jgi:hypothetical protein
LALVKKNDYKEKGYRYEIDETARKSITFPEN